MVQSFATLSNDRYVVESSEQDLNTACALYESLQGYT